MINKFVKSFIFSLIPLFVLLAGAEGLLRLTGFRYSNTPLEMRFEQLRREGAVPTFIDYHHRDGRYEFVKDPEQLWVPAEDFAEGVALEKKEGTLRVAALGCSCTAGCVLSGGGDGAYSKRETYPDLTQTLLNAQGQNVEMINAAVGGHSSYQGLRRLEHSVLPYEPDVLTIFYGWNDHWMSITPDKEVKIQSAWVTGLVNFYEKFRVAQFFNFVITKVRDRFKRDIQGVTLRPRVSPEDYEKNLNAMIDLGRARGARIILLTAPGVFDDFKPMSHFPFPKERLVPIHRRYNEIVRRVAFERGVRLLDLEKAAETARTRLGREILSRDGIHFSLDGCRFVAELLSAELVKLAPKGSTF